MLNSIVQTTVQITENTFSDPHPNPSHVVGVLYDPIAKTAKFTNSNGDDYTANLTEWICIENGKPEYVMFDEDYQSFLRLQDA